MKVIKIDVNAYYSDLLSAFMLDLLYLAAL